MQPKPLDTQVTYKEISCKTHRQFTYKETLDNNAHKHYTALHNNKGIYTHENTKIQLKYINSPSSITCFT